MIKMPSAEELAQLERQQRWRSQSVERLKADRATRLAVLEQEDLAERVRRAAGAYNDLDAPTTPLRLRTPFVALAQARPLPPALGGPEPEVEISFDEAREEDWRTRPPLTKLIMQRSYALPTYLAMLYVTQADSGSLQPGRRNVRANAVNVEGRQSWAVVTGRWGRTARARRARVARDLDDLARADLVEIGAPRQQGRYEGFGLLAETATSEPYRPPGSDVGWPEVMSLPSSFFRRGWHIVLTPAEIAALLVARHSRRSIPRSSVEPGTGIPQSTRWATYGLSGEAYGTIHELEEFGLLTVHDTMPHRRNGKFQPRSPGARETQEREGDSLAPVPYRLEPAGDEVFDRPALETVHACLFASPVPPRLL